VHENDRYLIAAALVMAVHCRAPLSGMGLGKSKLRCWQYPCLAMQRKHRPFDLGQETMDQPENPT
jgi:hypothetical protein